MDEVMKFNTPFDRVILPGEGPFAESEVETAGYISAEEQIRAMIMAGQRIRIDRSGYDLVDGEEDGDVDPTRDPSFDLADYSAVNKYLADKRRKHLDAVAKAKIDSEAAIAAKKASAQVEAAGAAAVVKDGSA